MFYWKYVVTVLCARQYVDFELNCINISVQTHFNFAVPNFKLKINNKIEFKARGNVLLEARGNGSMFTSVC